MVQNRAFQGTSTNLVDGHVTPPFENIEYYYPIGPVGLYLDDTAPTLTAALPEQLRLEITSNATGEVGFYNEGFWGYNVTTATTYTASFYLRGTFSGPITGSFIQNGTGNVLGSTTFEISQTLGDGWRQYEQVFRPTASVTDEANVFQITFDGKSTAGQILYFQMISVFQETYKDRKNGLRMDLAEGIADLNPRFLRFPGKVFDIRTIWATLILQQEGTTWRAYRHRTSSSGTRRLDLCLIVHYILVRGVMSTQTGWVCSK